MTNQFAIHRKPGAIALVVVGAISLGLISFKALDIVAALGYRLPQEDLATDYAKGVAWAIVLGLSILAWPVSERNKQDLLWVWFAKSLVTLGLMLFYEWNYPLDAHGYFDESRQRGFEWEGFRIGGERAGTYNMTNLCWLLQQLVPNSFHGLKVSFAMLGLIAVYLFYRAAVLFLGHEDRRIFFLLAFWPTVLFWSSILGKDPLVLLGIALYVYGAVGWIHMAKARYLSVLALGVMVAMGMRVWLGAIMFLPLALILLRGKLNIGSKVVFGLLVGVALWFSAGQFAEYFLLETTEELMEKTESVSAGFADSGESAGSSLEFKEYEGFGGMVAFLPVGIFTALFRPLPGEVLNVFGLLASLENIVALSLLCLAVIRTRWEELKEPVVMWAGLFVITWSAIYAFVSSYNLGTASRYRLQILPVMICLLVYLSRRRSPVPSSVTDTLYFPPAVAKTLPGPSS
jgi:hypothetical protein